MLRQCKTEQLLEVCEYVTACIICVVGIHLFCLVCKQLLVIHVNGTKLPVIMVISVVISGLLLPLGPLKMVITTATTVAAVSAGAAASTTPTL